MSPNIYQTFKIIEYYATVSIYWCYDDKIPMNGFENFSTQLCLTFIKIDDTDMPIMAAIKSNFKIIDNHLITYD